LAATRHGRKWFGGAIEGGCHSKAEKGGVKGSWLLEEQVGEQVPQVVGLTILSEATTCGENGANSRGYGALNSGIRIKELGDNLFLFSFMQPRGKRRALTNGLWEIGGDLLIVLDFDGSKRLKDLEFNYGSVWIRVFNLLLGMLNREAYCR
jgi:hypothetical protein